MFIVLGLSILLVAILVLNNAASLLAMLLWKVFGTQINRWPAQSSARTLFLLRTLPASLGISASLFLVVPAYLRHEPRVGHEDVSLSMAILATLSAIGLIVALVKGIATWRATRRLTAEWLGNAELIHIPAIKVPVYQVEHSFPLIAVVGAFRPRLFIARQIFQSLTAAELAAALEHENAHILAHDNLKRTLFRACRDLAPVSAGRDLEKAWLDASEAAADEFAARKDRKVGLDLAGAIVKIARMIPSGAQPTVTAGAFFASAEDARGFSKRVRRLIEVSENAKGSGSSVIPRLPLMIPAMLTILLFVLTESHTLSAIHGLIEHAVHFLD